ncbi:unnamed protein product [Rodentolepis nana]|uniref:Calponin-homology (CH) domain-containing protein n=1 Tax=Rodentolepis nana TaxID=102285 RepID=A0A0R3TW11_RODNA|nr:unnamed protein product [Rodentolepis nana]
MHQASPKIHTGLDTRASGPIGGVGEGSGRGDIGGSVGGGGHTMNLLDKLNTMSRVRRRKQEAEAALVDCAVPEKLEAFQQVLLQFANSHLGKLNIHVTDLQKEMNDGVYFLLLLGLLGGYFIPLHRFHLTPRTDEQKLANLQLVAQLVQEVEGIEPGPNTRPDDILRRDLKAILRFLYALYTRYKDIE